MDWFFIAALIVTSIVAVTFIVERGLALRWEKVVPAAVESAVGHYPALMDLAGVRQVCGRNPSPLGRLILCVADRVRWSREENVDALETRARHEVAGLERGLVVLEIVVGIAPLLGLVGTVYGLITLFTGLSQHGLGEYTHLARGIGLALNATLMGLLIAIPSLIAWSYYSKKVETLTIELETICDEFLRKSYRRDETLPGSPAVADLAPAESPKPVLPGFRRPEKRGKLLSSSPAKPPGAPAAPTASLEDRAE